MSGGLRSRDLLRARFALCAVKEWWDATGGTDPGGSSAGMRAAIVRVVEELPALLRTNGTGQTLGYLEGEAGEGAGARGDGVEAERSAAGRVYGAILAWLCEAGTEGDERPERIGDGQSVLSVIQAGTDRMEARRRYKRATEAAWGLASWLKPLATAYLKQPETTGERAEKPERPKGGRRRGAPAGPRGESRAEAWLLPWYRDLGPAELCRGPHLGLLYDRFFDRWARGWQAESKTRRAFLEDVLVRYRENARIGEDLTEWLACRRRLVQSLGGEIRRFTTDWRFVTGLGMAHVLEVGFLWHPSLSVPYLPGTSVKGLIRAWVDPGKGWAGADEWAVFRALFGDSDGLGAGSLVVFDALPATKPDLSLDIVNVHHPNYYQGESQQPADWDDPTPVYFLSVAGGVEFEFALAPRPGSPSGATVERGFALLKEALDVLGAGAKTAVGYGRMRPGPGEAERP